MKNRHTVATSKGGACRSSCHFGLRAAGNFDRKTLLLLFLEENKWSEEVVRWLAEKVAQVKT